MLEPLAKPPKEHSKLSVAISGNNRYIYKVDRREYSARLVVNGQRITKVIIDPHFELKHSRSIDDKTILQLVAQLDGRDFEADAEDGPFSVFCY